MGPRADARGNMPPTGLGCCGRYLDSMGPASGNVPIVNVETMRTWSSFHPSIPRSGSGALACWPLLPQGLQNISANHLENARASAPARRASVASGKRARLSSAMTPMGVACEVWSDWRYALVIFKPENVIAWHRRASGFSDGRVGTASPADRRGSQRRARNDPQKSRDNPLWGCAPQSTRLLNSASKSGRPAWASTSYASGSAVGRLGGPS